MNIQFSNWQLIQLQDFSNSFNGQFGGIQTNLTEVDSVLAGLSTQIIFIDDGNNNIGFGMWGGYDLTVRGSGFVTSANPVATSVSLVDPFRTYSFIGAINVTNDFAGFYGITGGIFTSITTLFKDAAIPTSNYSYSIKGNLIYSALGRIDGGTITSVTTSDNRFSLKGNLTIDADEVITGGIINEITYKSPTGESFSVSNASIPYLTFISLIPNDPSSNEFAPLINYLTSSTSLSGNDRITADAQNNALDGHAGVDTLIGGAGNDTYTVDLKFAGVANTATAVASLQDTITEANTVAGGIDTLILRSTGPNTLTKASLITLAAGLEHLDASGTGDFLLNLTGNTANNNIVGNDGNNILLGLTGNDTLDGGAGNDTLDGGVGVDSLTGGTGDDTYLVDLVASGVAPNVIANLQDTIVEDNGTTDGIDTLKLRGTVATSAANPATTISLAGALANIENLDVSLTGTTKLNLTGNDANNILIGNAAVNTLTGGDGNDTLDGGAGNDNLVGGDGNDTLIGGIGVDTFDGGIGDDTYVVDSVAEANAVIDADVNNTLNIGLAYTLASSGSKFSNLTLSGVAAVNATGNADNNTITGNSGANILNGNGGIDTLIGGNGGDTYIVDADDIVIETNALAIGGIDLVRSSVSFDLSDNSNGNIRENIEKLTLTDGTLNGGTAAIDATGNALANTLTGNAGNNIFDGGTGVDTLIGGAGNDTYTVDLKFAGVANTATAVASLQDTITEANTVAGGIDTLILRSTGPNTLTKASLITLAAGLEHLDASGTGDFLLNLTGNTANNNIVGNDGNNILLGLTGNDTLDGGAGNDTLDGGVGVDSLTGGTGDDTYIVDITTSQGFWEDSLNEAVGLSGGVDTLKLRGSAIIPAISNPTNIDLGDFSAGIENLDVSLTGTTRYDLQGNGLDNTLTGNAANNKIIGDLGNDILNGGAGNDNLVGGDGNDTLIGGIGVDTFDGGIGDDTYVVDSVAEANAVIDADVNNTLNIGLAYTLASSGSKFSNLTLSGVAAVNATGNADNNTITGNSGANILNGNGGIDTLIGGNGGDTYIVDADDIVIETNALAIGGIDLVRSSVSFDLSDNSNGNIRENIEKLTLTDGTLNGGTAAIDATGNALANTLTGNAGDNVLNGKEGKDALIGGAGNDTYLVDLIQTGTTATTFRVALQDSITDTAGTDTLILNNVSFDPTVHLNATALTLASTLENLDASATGLTKLNLTGNGLNNILTGNDENNVLKGGLGDDVMFGGNGNDDLWGDGGNDTLDGGEGSDYYVLDNINDVASDTGIADPSDFDLIFSGFNVDLEVKNYVGIEGIVADGTQNFSLRGNEFSNYLQGNEGANIVDGRAGNDNLHGLGGNDTINGGDGNDSLTGGEGNDTLSGGDNNDTLIGGIGNDILTGGLGADTFKWELADKGTKGVPSIDRISDFDVSQNDVLDLRDLLQGESSANILNYLDVTTNAGNTEIRISSTGSFASGNYSAGNTDARIVLTGVDLFADTSTGGEADLIQNLITFNKLIVD